VVVQTNELRGNEVVTSLTWGKIFIPEGYMYLRGIPIYPGQTVTQGHGPILPWPSLLMVQSTSKKVTLAMSLVK